MTTIKPLFPDQQSINAAVEKLNPVDRERYDELLRLYQELISAEHPDHEKLTMLITEAQEILHKALPPNPPTPLLTHRPGVVQGVL